MKTERWALGQRLADEDTDRWKAFVKAKTELSEIKMRDVPFPTDNHFAWKVHLGAMQQQAEYKKLRPRWHPQEFSKQFGPRLAIEEKDMICSMVNDTFQAVEEEFREIRKQCEAQGIEFEI